jgi:hypothetical protein
VVQIEAPGPVFPADLAGIFRFVYEASRLLSANSELFSRLFVFCHFMRS